MKKLSILSFGIAFLIVSCQKSSLTPSSNSLGASVTTELSLAKRTNFCYLTAHPWLYYKYYTGYVDSSNLGTLVYKRGGHHNTLDLDNDIATFNRNGTVDEYYNGTYIPGTWSFLDKAQTILQVINYTGVYISTIVELNNNHFNWHYTDIYGVERYGVEIPAY